MSFSIGDKIQGFIDKASKAGDALNEATDKVDPQNFQSLMKIQTQSGNYQNLVGTVSAVINSIKQAIQGIVQKI